MSGLEIESAAAAAPQVEDISKLTESFHVFTRVTRDLEAAYGRLRMRAESVDQRLREANGQLREKVVELEQVTGHLHGVLDAIPCGVIACDRDGSIVSMNRAAERILGRAAFELIGRDARAVSARDGTPLLALLGGGQGPVERDVESFDGSRRRVSSVVATLEDGGRIEVISDLTEVSHLRTQLNRLDTLAALGEMAAGIAHEIRNPLNGIEGFAGLLARMLASAEGIDRVQAQRYVDRVRRGVGEVNEIVTNLLLWARPERLARSTFGLPELVGEVIGDAPVLAGAQRHAAIECTGIREVTNLLADRVKLKIVLSNLLKNALEATGPDGRVVVAIDRSSTGLSIRVDDTGPGVPSDLRRKLFRPFITGKASGTGLGLAVARKLIEVHGGELQLVDGRLGGAGFLVTLPDRCVAASRTAAEPAALAAGGMT